MIFFVLLDWVCEFNELSKLAKQVPMALSALCPGTVVAQKQTL